MRYISFNELRAKLGGRERSTIYRDFEQGRIPAPLKIDARLYWVEADVDDHIASTFDPKRQREVS